LATRPAYALLAPAAVGLLPAWMRRELRLPLVESLDPVLVRPAARAVLRTVSWAIEGALAEDMATRAPAA
jgi:uncharacterized protein (DUF2236 family)